MIFFNTVFLDDQVLPSVTHITSLLKCKQLNSSLTNNRKTSKIIESTVDNNNTALEVIKTLIDEKQINFVIEHFSQPSFSKKSNKFKIGFVANLLSNDPENNNQPYKILYNSKKDSIKINDYIFKLSHVKPTTNYSNYVQKRHFNTRTGRR